MVAANNTELIAEIRERTPNILVSFSRGKDGIASYLRVRDEFERVIPYYYDFIPGLEFVEDSLAYYERLMGQRIARFPSYGMSVMIRGLVYQPPDRVDTLDWMQFPEWDNNHIQESVCTDAGLDYKTTYNAVGVRAKDSAMRAMVIKKYGAVNHKRRVFYPIFDFSKDELIDLIARSGWKLPIDYRYFSASFDGLYIRYLYPIKLYFPRDYQRILEWFPLAELECYRYEAAIKRGHQPAYVRPPGPHPYL